MLPRMRMRIIGMHVVTSGDAFPILHPYTVKMKFLLALCLAVVATARPQDDEWEQFKKVSFKLIAV